ncbi:MAG TPA: FHA domain-containing protein, partial [Bdellovibrionota bacterium]|nr:FHA domain-containing protein [Bdellovibrionota bacterium]
VQLRDDSPHFKDEGNNPDFESGEVERFEDPFNGPIYGKITAFIIPSKNKNLDIIFHVDDQGRVWVASMEIRGKAITGHGVLSEAIHSESFTEPAVNYSSEIPPEFKGYEVKGYYENSHVFNLGMVKDFIKYLKNKKDPLFQKILNKIFIDKNISHLTKIEEIRWLFSRRTEVTENIDFTDSVLIRVGNTIFRVFSRDSQMKVNFNNEERQITLGDNIEVGRGDNKGFVTNDPEVSRNHLTFSVSPKEGGGFVIRATDHGSKNGTWILVLPEASRPAEDHKLPSEPPPGFKGYAGTQDSGDPRIFEMGGDGKPTSRVVPKAEVLGDGEFRPRQATPAYEVVVKTLSENPLVVEYFQDPRKFYSAEGVVVDKEKVKLLEEAFVPLLKHVLDMNRWNLTKGTTPEDFEGDAYLKLRDALVKFDPKVPRNDPTIRGMISYVVGGVKFGINRREKSLHRESKIRGIEQPFTDISSPSDERGEIRDMEDGDSLELSPLNQLVMAEASPVWKELLMWSKPKHRKILELVFLGKVPVGTDWKQVRKRIVSVEGRGKKAEQVLLNIRNKIGTQGQVTYQEAGYVLGGRRQYIETVLHRARETFLGKAIRKYLPDWKQNKRISELGKRYIELSILKPASLRLSLRRFAETMGISQVEAKGVFDEVVKEVLRAREYEVNERVGAAVSSQKVIGVHELSFGIKEKKVLDSYLREIYLNNGHEEEKRLLAPLVQDLSSRRQRYFDQRYVLKTPYRDKGIDVSENGRMLQSLFDAIIGQDGVLARQLRARLDAGSPSTVIITGYHRRALMDMFQEFVDEKKREELERILKNYGQRLSAPQIALLRDLYLEGKTVERVAKEKKVAPKAIRHLRQRAIENILGAIPSAQDVLAQKIFMRIAQKNSEMGQHGTEHPSTIGRWVLKFKDIFHREPSDPEKQKGYSAHTTNVPVSGQRTPTKGSNAGKKVKSYSPFALRPKVKLLREGGFSRENRRLGIEKELFGSEQKGNEGGDGKGQNSVSTFSRFLESLENQIKNAQTINELEGLRGQLSDLWRRVELENIEVKASEPYKKFQKKYFEVFNYSIRKGNEILSQSGKGKTQEGSVESKTPKKSLDKPKLNTLDDHVATLKKLLTAAKQATNQREMTKIRKDVEAVLFDYDRD